MSVTMKCPRCATELHLISRPLLDAPGILRVVPHSCFRFLIAEHWENGEVTACWTSDDPGRTGPQGLARTHAQDADKGWAPPTGAGWTYRWKIDAEVFE